MHPDLCGVPLLILANKQDRFVRPCVSLCFVHLYIILYHLEVTVANWVENYWLCTYKWLHAHI